MKPEPAAKTSTVPKVCVIGWPIKHSRSPLIHSYWLDQFKISGSYERAEVRPEEFADFVGNLARNGFVGANVTLPHKEAAFALCDIKTDLAARLEAVNTLWIEAGKLCGDNSDVAGFLGALDQDAPGGDVGLERAVILGAGGAARAIIAGLLLRSVKEIMLVNRTEARAEDLAARFGPAVKAHGLADLPDLLGRAGLLVNTTSLGMTGQPMLDIDLETLPAQAVVNDIVYVPLETGLLHRARSRGLRVVGGLGMLLHQAVPGFEHWFGQRPKVSSELRTLIEADVMAKS